ncbi:MAG: diguanylate cyclase [Methylococcales bacterium]|nr:diguanylate cyclase [Methylococcales bacterium]
MIRSTILVVDDDPLNVKLLMNILEADYALLFALDGKKAIELAKQQQPDLILLDAVMPEQSGYQTCELLKKNTLTKNIPVIFISSLSDDEDEAAGLKCGAIDYITKPINTAIVKTRIFNHLELKHIRDLLQQQSNMDGLTGIANRRCFDESLLHEWQLMQTQQHTLGVIMIDIDYFKTFNDCYGHAIGDTCLKKVAMAMANLLPQSSSLLARYGGEEFVCILPTTSKKETEAIAINLCDAIKALKIPHADSQVDSIVTISLGCSTIQPTADKSSSEFMTTVDNALYQAKKEGRNCVITANMNDYSSVGSSTTILSD